jgi:neurotransmitter:Na+ symporter, NSS family
MNDREQWGSRIGLILAMAGNAVGLGNFLRFPVQAAQNGGGAFMIPYFIAFLLLAIPLMWVEWAIGRHGGKYNHGSLPGMFDSLWKNPIAKYLGVFGLFISIVVMIYYVYLVSWTLGFSFFSATGSYFGMEDFAMMQHFLHSYQGIDVSAHTADGSTFFSGIWTSYMFLLFTLGLTFFVVYKGISGGIEKFAKVVMPLLFIFGIGLAIWVFTIGTPNPANPEMSVWNGFAFIWNPNFKLLFESSHIWLAAAGQVFFTLSVGMGTLQAYASYLRKHNDIALSGLTTASLNEFAEIIIGSSIAIPILVAFIALPGTAEFDTAVSGSFNLGFVSMGVIFQQIPYGELIGFSWFFLLFLAGITSAVAMSQPLISFFKEQFDFSHRKAVGVVFALVFVVVHFVVFYLQYGFLDEMDFWVGSFGLVVIAFIEVLIFGWFFGIDKAWEEITFGADMKVPRIFRFVIKYVTPVYLLFILIFWTVDDAIPVLMMERVEPENAPYIFLARMVMTVIFVGLLALIFFAVKRNNGKLKTSKGE